MKVVYVISNANLFSLLKISHTTMEKMRTGKIVKESIKYPSISLVCGFLISSYIFSYVSYKMKSFTLLLANIDKPEKFIGFGELMRDRVVRVMIVIEKSNKVDFHSALDSVEAERHSTCTRYWRWTSLMSVIECVCSVEAVRHSLCMFCWSWASLNVYVLLKLSVIQSVCSVEAERHSICTFCWSWASFNVYVLLKLSVIQCVCSVESERHSMFMFCWRWTSLWLYFLFKLNVI